MTPLVSVQHFRRQSQFKDEVLSMGGCYYALGEVHPRAWLVGWLDGQAIVGERLSAPKETWAWRSRSLGWLSRSKRIDRGVTSLCHSRTNLQEGYGDRFSRHVAMAPFTPALSCIHTPYKFDEIVFTLVTCKLFLLFFSSRFSSSNRPIGK